MIVKIELKILLKKLTVQKVSKEMNVTRGNVYEWVRKYREDPKDFMLGSEQTNAEVLKILRENKQLKAALYFAKDYK